TPASLNCSATTSSNRSARSGSASTCRPPCRPIGRCEFKRMGSGELRIGIGSIRYSLFATRYQPSRLLQRRGEILDQIVGMFEAGGETDEAFADAEFGARLRRQPLMRGG